MISNYCTLFVISTGNFIDKVIFVLIRRMLGGTTFGILVHLIVSCCNFRAISSSFLLRNCLSDNGQ